MNIFSIIEYFGIIFASFVSFQVEKCGGSSNQNVNGSFHPTCTLHSNSKLSRSKFSMAFLFL